MSRSVVIVSPYFPPSSLAGVHRARHLAKHLPATGWTPIVLCVDEAFHEQRTDKSLAALVPNSVEVIKVAAAPISMTRPIGIGDISLRAWWSLKYGLVELLETRKISAVLITGSPYYPMLLSRFIQEKFGVPVILDFQDPWISSWGAKQPHWSKAGLSHRLATLLEPIATRHAAYVTSVSQNQNDEMCARSPWIDRSRTAAIAIGGDAADFDHARDMPTVPDLDLGDTGLVELSYVGAYWPAAEAPIRAFLTGVARLRQIHPEVARRLRLNFVGTDATLSSEQFHVRQLAESIGVSDLVREVPRRLPYLAALAVMARSNGLILIGSDEPHYTASKIYPALMSGRPYLSLFHKASSAHTILSAAGGGVALGFGSAADLSRIDHQVADGLYMLANTPDLLGKADATVYAPYEDQEVARQFAAVFEEVSRHS